MHIRTIARAGVIAFALVSVAACGTDAPDGAGTSATGAVTGAGAAVVVPSEISPGGHVEFVATEFSFAPSEITATAGAYSGTLVNHGTMEHDIKFDNGVAVVAAPGESVTFDFEVPAEGIRYVCSIPGHADAGMQGMIRTDASPDGDTAGTHVTADEPMAVEADPDAPPYEWRDPRAPLAARAKGSHSSRAAHPTAAISSTSRWWSRRSWRPSPRDTSSRSGRSTAPCPVRSSVPRSATPSAST